MEAYNKFMQLCLQFRNISRAIHSVHIAVNYVYKQSTLIAKFGCNIAVNLHRVLR